MLTYQTMLARLVVACLCGALIGIERERHGRAAGLRTHLLVALGAATIMIMSLMIPELYLHGNDSSSIIRSDPARIAAQIVTGIGFLGAGAIIQTKRLIRGLTTAACLWIAAGIGMAAGMGMLFLAAASTVFSLLTLYALKWLEYTLPKDHYYSLELHCHYHPEALENIKRILTENGVKLIRLNFNHDKKKALLILNLELRLVGRQLPQKLLNQLDANQDILNISLK
ncbi:MAG: MgtC/SapB family protein [Deltaproteobacteria bacterium]|nr:MAG: MgtC/SapB family protein [Deltaproteobacteria bacterium]